MFKLAIPSRLIMGESDLRRHFCPYIRIKLVEYLYDYFSTPTNPQYRAILFCDVVAGRKYTLHKNDPHLEGPPNGYHSVYGKAKWLWKSSRDFKDDELVVFKAAAIRPRFILLCENL